MPNWGIRHKNTSGSVARHSLGANGDYAFGTNDFTIEYCMMPVRQTVVDANANFNSGMYFPFSYYCLYFGTGSGAFTANILGYGFGNNSSNPWSARFWCRDTSTTSNLAVGDLAIATNYRFSNGQAPVMHFAGTRSTTTGKFFVNGVEKASGSTTTTANITGASTKILFGGTSSHTTMYIRISNVARDATWLTAHYEDKYYTDANVVGLYNFSTEKGSGTTITDTSGNARHGTLDTTYGDWVKVSNIYEGKTQPG